MTSFHNQIFPRPILIRTTLINCLFKISQRSIFIISIIICPSIFIIQILFTIHQIRIIGNLLYSIKAIKGNLNLPLNSLLCFNQNNPRCRTCTIYSSRRSIFQHINTLYFISSNLRKAPVIRCTIQYYQWLIISTNRISATNQHNSSTARIRSCSLRHHIQSRNRTLQQLGDIRSYSIFNTIFRNRSYRPRYITFFLNAVTNHNNLIQRLSLLRQFHNQWFISRTSYFLCLISNVRKDEIIHFSLLIYRQRKISINVRYSSCLYFLVCYIHSNQRFIRVTIQNNPFYSPLHLFLLSTSLHIRP